MKMKIAIFVVNLIATLLNLFVFFNDIGLRELNLIMAFLCGIVTIQYLFKIIKEIKG